MSHFFKALSHLVTGLTPWHVRKWAAENDMPAWMYRRVIVALYQSHWWEAWGKTLPCGCTRAFGRFRMYAMRCPKNHGGLSALFGDVA